MSTPLTLVCLVHGENPLENAFSIDVDENTTISKLKEVIKAKKIHYFENIDANRLILWRVMISLDTLTTLDTTFDIGAYGKKISPLFKVSELFPDVPNGKQVHIVVQIPQNEDLPKQLALSKKMEKIYQQSKDVFLEVKGRFPLKIYAVDVRFRIDLRCD